MDMSIAHLILLFFILLLVFGPSRLEGLGLSLGRAIRGFKKGLEEGSEEEAKKDSSSDKKTKSDKSEPNI
jgi:sec-independent protein translocase protein TatA